MSQIKDFMQVLSTLSKEDIKDQAFVNSRYCTQTPMKVMFHYNDRVYDITLLANRTFMVFDETKQKFVLNCIWCEDKHLWELKVAKKDVTPLLVKQVVDNLINALVPRRKTWSK